MNNDDTISRARIKEIRSRYADIKTADDYRMMPVSEIARMRFDIKRLLKAIDALPQVAHGHLVSTGYDEMYCEFGNCTVCGADNPMHNKYCRECGVKLDGGEDDADN